MSSPVFVDTSGLYAALDADDDHHHDGAAALRDLLDGVEAGSVRLVTHGSVVVELAALAQRRLGIDAVRTLLDDLIPLCEVVWVDAELHREATTALLAAGRRDVSLVDWTSFVVMRRAAIERAFAFDDDFVAQGFEVVPA